MEPEVGELLDEALVGVGDGRQCRLDPSSPTFCAAAAIPRSSSRRRTSLPASSLARSATTRHSHGAKHDSAPVWQAGPAGSTRSRIASPSQSSRISTTAMRVPRGRALVPVLLPRPAPEPGLARLARSAERLLVHPGEHEHPAGRRVLHDRRNELVVSHPDVPSRLLQLGLQLGQPLGPLVHDRGDDRRLGADLERLRQVALPLPLHPRRSPAPRRRPRRLRVSGRS